MLEVHERHDLDSLAQRHLRLDDHRPTTRSPARARAHPVLVGGHRPRHRVRRRDADCTLALHELLSKQIERDEKLSFVYGKIEMPVLPVLFRMERNGVLLDRAKLEAQSHELGKEMLEKEQTRLRGGRPAVQPRLAQADPGDPVRPPQAAGEEEDAVGPALHRRGRARRARARPSAAEADPRVPRAVQAEIDLHRQAAEERQPAHRARAHDVLADHRGDRDGSRRNEPNLQNIPIRTPAGRRIRECFIAPPGSKIVSADYSQIELRIMAHLSGDENLLRAFSEGEDVHRATAAEVFGLSLERVGSEQRRVAKVINFGLIYGMSSFGVAQNLGIDRSTAQTYIERYFARYPGSQALHGRDAPARARARATSKPCSAGGCGCRRCAAARRCAARPPSARRSTRRCRARRPTSSSSR